MYKTATQSLQKVLRPETVAALEHVPFTIRAEALPAVEEANESIYEVPSTGDHPEEEMIDVTGAMSITPDSEERLILMPGVVVAGGLCYDRDSQHLNPCEDGGANGNIYHCGRRGNAEEQAKYFQALGLDSDGNRDYSGAAVRELLVKHVMKDVRNDLPLLTRLLRQLSNTGRPVSMKSLEELVRFSLNQEGPRFGLDYLVDNLYGVSYWSELSEEMQEKLEMLSDAFAEIQIEKAWEEARGQGLVGNPLAIPLDIYEHGGIAYSVSGTGMSCQFDTSRAAAVWVPDEDAIDNIRSAVLAELGIGRVQWFGAVGSSTDPLHACYTLDGESWHGSSDRWSWREALDRLVAASPKRLAPGQVDALMYAKAREYCRGVLEEYSAWVNGEVYGVVVYVIDRETGDRIDEHDHECWGFIGSEYAEDELERIMLSMALTLGRPH